MWGGTDERESSDAIRASIDEGVSLIDTAPAYGMGRSEEIVGQAISGRRDDVVLATKCGLVWHTQKGNHFFDQQDKPVHRYLGKDSIVYELEQSLKRLKTDYIDVYITHWQDPTTPVEETMEAMHLLKKQGKIRAVGASNTSVADVEAYLTAGQLDCLQEEYSMVHRDIETTLLPISMNNNVAMLSYSSLALGLLSGKIDANRKFEGDDQRKDNPRFSPENRQKVMRFMDEIAPVCETHKASKAQIVIAWTCSSPPGITFSLCGARNPRQAKENAKAGTIKLKPDEMKQIDAAVNAHLSNLDG